MDHTTVAKGPRLQGLIGSTGCRLQRREGNREEEEGEREGKGENNSREQETDKW